MENMKLLFVIVDRDQVDKVQEAVRKSGTTFCHICYGKGTAKNDLLNILGLGETDKGILLAAVTEKRREQIFSILKEKFNFEKAGAGISFTVPLTSVGGPASLKLMQG